MIEYNIKPKQERESLWNLTDDKVKTVHEYIHELTPNDKWSIKAKRHFNRVIGQALTTDTANEALELIGYRFRKMPLLFDKCWDLSNNGKD